MSAPQNPTDRTFLFGPFRLSVAQRKLWRGTTEVPLGGRAFDILTVLVTKPGVVVSQLELIERVWPGLVVEDANLRVHMAQLRKALSDCDSATVYIETVPRRGYCFISSVSVDGAAETVSADVRVATRGSSGTFRDLMPAALARMVGRDAVVKEVTALLRQTRFVTIVGAGGMGKTTVALAVANGVLSEFDGAGVFVDLTTVVSREVVDIAVATALGLSTNTDEILPQLVRYVRDNRLLLVLDNCEHVVDAVALLAEQLFASSIQLTILATSREALRVEGENVFLLASLEGPPPGEPIGASEALSWPAVQLFLERAAANGYRGELVDRDVPAVAYICDRLDGIPLAIEIAAAQTATHGIDGTRELLDHRLKLVWQGRRSAVPRHQTMSAIIEWSFELLSSRDKSVLRRLSIFSGTFTLAAAKHIAVQHECSMLEVAASLSSLADRSLIWATSADGQVRYRLLEITRGYAAVLLEESGEHSTVAAVHAEYVGNCIAEKICCQSGADGTSDDIGDLAANLRAAIANSFANAYQALFAVELVARAVPWLLSQSLLRECWQWCAHALRTIALDQHGTAIEMSLCEGLASAGMFTRGNRDEIRSAIERGLTIACDLGSEQHEFKFLSALHMYMSRVGDFKRLLVLSRRASDLAKRLGDAESLAMANWMMATALHLAGDQAGAQAYCETAELQSAAAGALHLDVFGYDQRLRGLIVLIRVLWLRGYHERAARISHEIIADADRRQQPVATCIALIYTTSVSLWSLDLENASLRVDRLISCATENSLEPYCAVGAAMRGEISILRGNLSDGISELRAALATLDAENHHVLSTGFRRALAEALAKRGQHEEAETLMDSALSLAEKNGEIFQLPDLLRARGEVLAARGTSASIDSGMRHIIDAISRARDQSLRGWMLRATPALAKLLIARGRTSEALAVLDEAHAAFDEGFEQPLMNDVRKMTETLRASNRITLSGSY